MILALDTATRFLSIALASPQKLLAERSWSVDNQHTVELAPAIEQMLTQVNIQPQALTAIVVSQGPGSFTGVRIGMALAKGMAQALSIPLVAVPTLDIVAAASPYFDGHLMACIQAGRGRIIVGAYRWHEGAWRQAGEPSLSTWEAVLQRVDAPCLVNGEIDELAYPLLEQQKLVHLPSLGMQMRRAGFLAQLGYEALQKGYEQDLATIVPIYVKQP